MKFLFIIICSFFSISTLHAQQRDTLSLLDGHKVALTLLNNEHTDSIKDVKLSTIEFKGKIKGSGKPNIINVAKLNHFLRKAHKKIIKKIVCSYYIEQGKTMYYIRSYKVLNEKLENQNIILKGFLYELFTEGETLRFVILNGVKAIRN